MAVVSKITKYYLKKIYNLKIKKNKEEEDDDEEESEDEKEEEKIQPMKKYLKLSTSGTDNRHSIETVWHLSSLIPVIKTMNQFSNVRCSIVTQSTISLSIDGGWITFECDEY